MKQSHIITIMMSVLVSVLMDIMAILTSGHENFVISSALNDMVGKVVNVLRVI